MKVYFPKLNELIEKLLAKFVASKVFRKKSKKKKEKNTNIQLETLQQHKKKTWILLALISWDHHKFYHFLIHQFSSSIYSQNFTKYGYRTILR